MSPPPAAAPGPPIGVLYEFWPRADGTSRMEFVSAGAEEFLEATAEELGAWLESGALPLYGIDPAAFYQSIGESLHHRRPWSAEMGFVTPRTGRRLWLRLQSYPKTAADGRLYFSGHWIDLTPMKAAEEASRRAYRVLNEHLVNTPLAVIEWDADFRVARWSGQAEAIFGWKTAEVLGKAADGWPFVHEDDAERVAGVIRRLHTQAEPRNVCVNKNLHRSGRVLHCEWHNSVVVDEGGKLVSILSLVQDHTARVELDRQLSETHRLESIGLLAGGIAHDFNNILTIVVGHAGLLRDASSDPAAAFSLNEIDAACTRAAQLCEQVTAFAGIGRLSVGAVDLNETVRGMEDRLLAASGRPTAFALAADPPPLRGEPRQIEQVVANLVANAHESLPEAGATVEVSTAIVSVGEADADAGFAPTPAPGRYVRLRVRDTGTGISEELRSQVFEPFFSTKRLGRGLGLPAVRGIVRGHQGSMRVAPTPGGGTTVDVLFPAAEVVAQPPRERPAVSAGAILVVDDEMHIRELIASLLEEEGYRIETAAEAVAAQAAFARRPDGFAAAIVDVRMPGVQGPELVARLRERRPRLPAVVISGFAESELPAELWAAGPTALLPKPFSFDQLKATLKELLGPA